jgi:hypothetical protein
MRWLPASLCRLPALLPAVLSANDTAEVEQAVLEAATSSETGGAAEGRRLQGAIASSSGARGLAAAVGGSRQDWLEEDTSWAALEGPLLGSFSCFAHIFILLSPG